MFLTKDTINMLPEPEDFGTLFHEMYRILPDSQRRKQEWKKSKRKCVKIKYRQKNKLDLMTDYESQIPPELELPGNASAFAMFASVRLAVLERWMRQASQEYLQSSCSNPVQDQSEIDTDTEDNSQSSSTYIPVRVSKIVGLGLRSVFELIKESRTSHPGLCTKALSALLDVLQGQMPEGLKAEPSDVIDSLFELLLDLATLHGPESSVANDGTHLTAIACACLLSLVVVRGDTGKYLSATAALLMCPRALAMQNIQMPGVLTALQRSIHGILLGKTIRPDWITHGVPHTSKIDSFQVRMPSDVQNVPLTLKSLATDGQYLYLFSSRGLFKIGSGYGGTLKGHVYIWKPDFYPNDKGSLVYCDNNLYLKLIGRRGGEFLIIERQGLLISGSLPVSSRDAATSVVFSDGELLGTISPTKDDGFVVRMLNHKTVPASLITELPLKLARKCVDALGIASYESDIVSHTVNVGNEEEVATVCGGKEFGLLRTTSGKVFYCGKAASLGVKQVGVRTGKWTELVLTKTPKITHVAMGHDGLHSILLTEDGSVFFAGTARRGEDGDQNKMRRQPKPTKPKKMIKVDGQFIVNAACNNGSTALVTRDGELLMFGKDTTHADHTTGLVCNLKGEFIVQVALGKAHAVALTTKGQVFTFGINNKYQCGRDFMPFNKEESAPTVVAMETGGASHDEQDMFDDLEEIANREEIENVPGSSDGNVESIGRDHMCPPGSHQWHHDMCMVCTVCQECTGYSISCLSSMRPDRKPGQECGCGEGDSGCAMCGCCRLCARDTVDNRQLAILGPDGAADLSGMMRLDLIFRDKVKEFVPPRQRTKLQEQLQSRLEERKSRARKSISVAGSSKQVTAKLKSVRSSPAIVPSTPVHRASNSPKHGNPLGKETMGSDVERDTTRIACLPPAKIQLPCDSPITQIACGLHHTVLLLQNGQVYSFGSNQYGQLGCGDIAPKSSIQLVKLPCSIVHIAAGSNHTVVLTGKGEVYTFGNYQKGQLGRIATASSPPDAQVGQSNSSKYRDPRWFATPGLIPNIGPKHGRRATWVGASGDQTFLKIDESLINSVSLAKSTVTANRNYIILLPNQLDNANSFRSLIINKREGNCNSFKSKNQVDFYNKTICMDSVYNILWTYNATNHDVTCYNIIASDLRTKSIIETSDKKLLSDIKMFSVANTTKDEIDLPGFNLSAVLSAELALPVVSNCHVTRLQAAINLLCCLDTLTIAHNLQMTAIKDDVDDRRLVAGKQFTREDFQCVNRFESHGGGWGYSGHSIEAIRFMADTDVLLGGFGLFGGRGEYTGKIKLLDIGPDGGEQENDGELLAETDEIPYECGPRQKYPMMFEDPVPLQAHRWYVAWSRISGPSSDCGSSGQTMVTTEDQVLFYFKSSKKSNNGTDVNAGQIPQLLYKVITAEIQPPRRQLDLSEPIHILSKDFSRTVTKECIQSLLSLLQWSWNTFKLGIMDGQAVQHMYTTLELERLVYISCASLRLIRTYTNEIYPSQISKKAPLENVHLAESIGDVRALLKQILSDILPATIQGKKSSKSKVTKNGSYHVRMMNSILEECHGTFVACFHAFYPTSYLKWTCLCDLLADIEKENDTYSSSNSQRLLSAVLCALCSPSVRLRTTFPLLPNGASTENSINRGLSPSDNTGLPAMNGTDSHHYPVLVEQMTYRSQMEANGLSVNWTWKEVLDHLLKLVTEPVNQVLLGHRITYFAKLVRHCCHLLARVVAELVHQCSSTEEDLQSACGRILHVTPSRFTRTNQSRTWNTGNGSPDAICFQVDRTGVSVAGVGIYGGIGHYEYELELLEDQSSMNGADSHTHTQRWNSLEITRGSFGPEDFVPDIAEIKFDKAVHIKENVKYAIRLRNHGGRTNNGDGGLNSVKGSDNTTFTFSTCSLSFNGTTLTRGQIPVILYYSNPVECAKVTSTKLEQHARKGALSMTSSIIRSCCNLLAMAREKAEDVSATEILSSACVVTTLLPLLMAHISPLASSDPRNAVYILNLIQDMLPHVAALNLLSGTAVPPPYLGSSGGSGNHFESNDINNTTSQHYTWIQSDHPYKPSTVSNYRVAFPETVRWMSLEFDPSCSTAQPEDSLQLYVPSLGGAAGVKKASESDEYDGSPLPYWPVLHKFTGCTQWPQSAVILPGNEVIFSLETASDYLKDERASFYGFKCLVVGYEWPFPGICGPSTGLKHLEAELSFLGGMCSASLIKKDLLLPNGDSDGSDLDVEIAELVAAHALNSHGSLLGKGLALSSPPSVNQALDGTLPYSIHSNERLFLRDFVGCVAGSSGGRLAQWLQPGSRVDPARCQVLYSREDLRCGWPAIVTVLTRDQYSDLVHVPTMKVEVKAIPIDKKELGDHDFGRKIRRVSLPDPLTFGGFPPPPLHHAYEQTVRDKMCFHSITVMKAYQNYSFEELRYTSPPVKRSSENMLVRPNGDGTYSATWTPASVGCYSIVVNIDGYDMEEVFKVEVKEPPQGMTPPTQNLAKKPTHQPSKLRKFVAKNSAGLRVRTHPSLQSEQIGVVHVNGTIAFIDEIHNDDGVWLRLSPETIKQYCTVSVIEAWCLQYNQHLGKTLLLPVEEPKSILDQVITETIMRKLPEIHDRRKASAGFSGAYQVIKCGASGHNVRARPSLKAAPVGMLVLGNRIGVTEYVVNCDGCWVQLDQATKEKYCFNIDGEAWSLAMGHNNVLYIGTLSDMDKDVVPQLCADQESPRVNSNKRGFDFTHNSVPSTGESTFSFGVGRQPLKTPIPSADALATNPFVFGDKSQDSPKVPRREKSKDCSKPSSVPKWVKIDESKREVPSEFSGVSVKDLVKAIGESRANGNGITPPETPKRNTSPRGGGHLSPKVPSRSSSPVAIPPPARTLLHDSGSSSPQGYGSPRSIGISPLARRGSNQSDTSAFISSLTRDLSQSPSQATQPRDLSPSPSGSSLQTRSDSSPQQTPNKRQQPADLEQSPRKLTQTGTQTSPESGSNVSLKGHFSIGAAGKEDKISPKMLRKDRAPTKVRPKRAISPANIQQTPASTSKVNYPGNAIVKQAMSPSVAESLRAVFAAFLWHEGIVHDAMACASFLKFHPSLPKQGALVVTRGPSEQAIDKRYQELTKEERARQRHSVEVSTAGTYLHIQPSTLETLTRSAINASANRSRNRKFHDGTIKEDATADGGYGYQTVSVLPPALKSLVYLWEELTANCLQAMTQQMMILTPVHSKVKKSEKVSASNFDNKEVKEKNTIADKENKKCRKKKIFPRNHLDEVGLYSYTNMTNVDRETFCELCGELYPHPVTYHMRQAHVGCGLHAGGRGYNSGGNYCLGWAGNCGEGGVAGSSWYLLCETCREKYTRAYRSGKQGNRSHKAVIKRKNTFTKAISSPGSVNHIDTHIVMKNNAIFLLDLASSADMGISHRRASMSTMPSLSEHNLPPDLGGPFSPLPPFQCLQALGALSPYEETPFCDEELRRKSVQEGFLPGPSHGVRPLSEVSLSDNDMDGMKGLRFHRSVSMGTNGAPWAKTGYDGRIIMMRKRNNSSSEMISEGGSSLLCNPSSTLQKLVPNIDSSSIVANAQLNSQSRQEKLSLLQRPVMLFILQQHDLDSLQLAMKQALRKAMCRVYAMQALNWLLRSVTQPVCLHDLLWWFVTSLSPLDLDSECEDDNKPHRKLDDQDLNVCEHPLSDITIAGEAVNPLPSTFHGLLQTIADLMVLLPMGSALQQMAVRCWGLRFMSADHSFLHRSQVFSNISKILSRSEELEDCTISMQDSHQGNLNQQLACTVEGLKDLTSAIEIKASSRQAMVGSLTDSSTETFWESGDEDRNKTKSLIVVCAQNHHPKMVCVHIDNCRDLANKVSSVAFSSGPNSDDFVRLRTIEVETRLLGGWISCAIQDVDHTVIRIELKGPDNSVRVRQIQVLGEVTGESLKLGKQYSALTIQQRNCESETLRVFRLITSQVFGKLIVGDMEGHNLNNLDSGSGSASDGLEPIEESNDLREHMVGILFSRSKLTHLQKQVIVHIVQAIRKETARVRDEWESFLCSATAGSASSGQSLDAAKNSDNYCFEMLSMVLALSGSSVGRTYLSHQGDLLGDILSLLHTGSARVQRQVTALLRRILPEITPEFFAKIVGVTHLPPKDFSIVSVANKGANGGGFDIHRIGMLDVFLSIIGKALTVQVKMKSKSANGGPAKEISTVTLATSMQGKEHRGRWWLRGTTSRKLAEVIVHLLKDMAAGKLSEPWANVTKGAIAENILNLTHLTDEQRVPTTCLHTPTLWLALASLCVLDKDHVERLSSGQWSNADGQAVPPGPTCTNHDDGETNAIIQCNTCGNLCADCDRFLHLHRKTRMHQRQVCKEEEEAIKVELHEGCGRTKLFWLLALADARTLKALIEYREGSTRTRGSATSGVCRFCGATGNSGLLAIGNVCADQECQEYARTACTKLLNCGHMCGGVQGESTCLLCLHGCSSDSSLRQDADDMCMICFTEALSCAPAIQLKCGHVFHLHCSKAALMKRWAGPRITFSFALCPICKDNIDHVMLIDLLTPVHELYKDVRRKALMRLEYEGLHTVEAITAPGTRYYNDPAAYAMDRYAYYVCYKCSKAYYGGEARCDAEVGENYDPTELVCGACSDVARAQMCPKHGTDFLEYKCRYCCSVAVFFCFGTTHFCNPCHDDFQRVTNLPKNELPICPAGPKAKQLEGDECPLHVKHPPTGEEFALGCGVCRNAHTF
ncbi:hypothetical protein PPYR_10895 [Photinus pyralis]|uniref:RCR-type E3 ubiquitin transferase n=2 Tax=Photinus pyralis TaxID=7054 RepID=A0A5N4AHP9_PHOPY|nr:hypothetical protein PPYR_10895 [Photinus pyralis]